MDIIVKDVIEYEGLYIIDNLGNVVSLPKIQGRRVHNKYKILTTKLNKNGYLQIYLSKNGKLKTFLLHRLLAIHFIPNPKKLNQVNHINGIKIDNRLENLEWCSKQENTKYAFDNNLGNFKVDALKRLDKVNYYNSYIKVIFTKDGKSLEFSSVKEAALSFNLKGDNITRAIKNKQNVGGYHVVGFKREK